MENQQNPKIDIGNIYAAGIAIKGTAYVLLTMLISAIIGVLVASASADIGTIKKTCILLGILNLIFIIMLIVKLFQAGNYLEKSV